MALPAILGRWYNRPVINLGFSGNGMLELELADLLGELDASVYCVDCLPNLVPELVKQRTIPFIERLRKHKPDTPILMVEDRTYTHSPFFRSLRDRHTGSRGAFRAGFEALKKAGDENLHYLEGKDLLGSDGEAATDGSHPNDLGFMRYAEHYKVALDQIIPTASGTRCFEAEMKCGFVDMQKSTTINRIAVFICVILCSCSLSADEGIDFFEAKIRPLLVQHCYECHSGKTGVVESGFDMDTRTGMLAGRWIVVSR